MDDRARPWTNADRFVGIRHRENHTVRPGAGPDAVILQSKGLGRMIGHGIEGLLEPPRRGHVVGVGQHVGDIEHLTGAEGVERIADAVLTGGHIHTGVEQFRDAGQSPALRIAVVAALEVEVDRRIRYHMDAGLPEQVDDFPGMNVVIARQCADMAGGDAALPTAGDCLGGEVFGAERLGVVGLVDVAVDVDVELLGEIKEQVDMTPGVLGGAFVVGNAADKVAAHDQGLAHLLEGTGITEEAVLRKDGDLDSDVIRTGLPGGEDALGQSKTGGGGDINVCANVAGAETDFGMDRADRPFSDVLRSEGSLGVGPVADGLKQGAALVGLHEVYGVSEVEMQMRIDQTRKNEPALCVEDAAAGFESQLGTDLLDGTVIVDADVR